MKKLFNVESKNLSMLVSAGTEINGNIVAKGDVELYGAVSSDNDLAVISEGKVHVYSEGRVIGNIQCKDLVLEGEVEGDVISTGKVHLLRDSKIDGNIQAASLEIEEGTLFNGSVNVAKTTPEVKIKIEEER